MVRDVQGSDRDMRKREEEGEGKGGRGRQFGQRSGGTEGVGR